MNNKPLMQSSIHSSLSMYQYRNIDKIMNIYLNAWMELFAKIGRQDAEFLTSI